jgi:hypothetical protein
MTLQKAGEQPPQTLFDNLDNRWMETHNHHHDRDA